MPHRVVCHRVEIALLGALFLAGIPLAEAADPNVCDLPGEEPDVIVGDMAFVRNWGKIGDITGFSIATQSCNIGTCWLNWFDDNGFTNENRHPVIGQNLFRLKSGRFEQIGQSWLKHGFFATNGTLCETGCIPTNGDHLGVNCADPYSSTLNGNQPDLGPKFQVNPVTGAHPHPFPNGTGNAIYKRLQVHDADLNPAQNAGASYFIEAQYVTQDDTATGNQHNSISYRPANVDLDGGEFDITPIDDTVRESPAIAAWAASDPTVHLVVVDVPADGRFIVAAKATALGGGLWQYEYAVQNQNSDRAAGSFSVPIPTGASVSGLGFHDVEYHSGEPYAGTNWPPAIGTTAVSWATTPVGVDPNANALRWGTLYNFRLNVNSPPATGPVTLGLFKTGSPSTIAIATIIPAVCNQNSICELVEECICPLDCAGDGTDLDGDSVGQCVDCQEGNAAVWRTPGEVVGGAAAKSGAILTLTWSPPADPGATAPTYDVLRSSDPKSFTGASAICLADPNPSDTTVSDTQNPLPNKLFAYLIRAKNGCAAGVGSLGTNSQGVPRSGRSCP